MEEMLDLVNEQGDPIGRAVPRSEAHRLGLRHRTSHVWLVRRKNGVLEVLLQKRSDEKDSFPGCYDISSAGHIPAGQGFVDSALRELKEETGYIRDAMKLRNIHGTQKIECLLVPTMISATTTAEELSAAAVTRGIENPAPKTSMIEMKFGVQDFVCLAIGVAFCVVSIMVG